MNKRHFRPTVIDITTTLVANQ